MRSGFLIFIFAIFCNYSFQYELSIHRIGPEFKEFNQHLQKHGITFYDSQAYLQRLDIYLNNKEYIQSRNQQGLSFTLGMNQFGHWTNKEYKTFLRTHSAPLLSGRSNSCEERRSAEIKDFDYRDIGAVTAVKNQGQCGSCWAFSAVGALESQYILATKQNVTFSEQELVDCSDSFGNEGCNGGLMDLAFEYVKQNGIANGRDYPYLGIDGKCQAALWTRRIHVVDIYDVQSGNETDLALALLEVGPVSVAIDASSWDFQFYQSGIYESDSCSSEDLDHGVLLVGIGSKPRDFYVVKNSWGSYWGDSGYIYMARNRNNMCGIATASSYAKIKINTD